MKTRMSYLHVHQMYALELACIPLQRAFGNVYLVGSVLTRPDYRDVDIRVMMEEVDFVRTTWSDRHELLRAAITVWLQQRTGLPIDFDFQEIKAANAEFNGQRSAIGFKMLRKMDDGKTDQG